MTNRLGYSRRTLRYSGAPTWRDADEYLARRDDRPIANNTRLIRRSADEIAVRLHATDVVTILRDGTYRLDSGGWRTPTTKDRITTYSPARVASERGAWVVWRPGRRMVDVHTGATWRDASPSVPFWDGMTVDADGWPATPVPDEIAAEQAQAGALRLLIRRYAARYRRALMAGQMPLPSGADCWDCAAFDRPAAVPSGATDPRLGAIDYRRIGADGAEISGAPDNAHLLAHIGADPDQPDDFYLVPSLAVNALYATGRVPPIGVGYVIGAREDGTMRPDAWHATRIARAIREYLTARLIDRRPAV